MKQANTIFTPLQEPFVAGSNENLSSLKRQLWKLDGGSIYLCRKGWAQISINLKEYRIVPHTQVVLMPGSIVKVHEVSDDCCADYFDFSSSMFHEVCMRFDTNFFAFLREEPCYTYSNTEKKAIEGLMYSIAIIYADKENVFRYQIARNHLHSFLLDLYDKIRRKLKHVPLDSGGRQEELLKKFMHLVNKYCISEREVSFYANELCISTKYLTGICRNLTGESAKKLIDKFVTLEIKVLLQATELSIQEIADRLSFPDQSYLGRFFKRHEGVSPKEYQQKYVV